MPTVYQLLDAGRQFLDDNGDPAAGYQLFAYGTGSSTKKTTYKDASGATAHTNPIVLDAAGRLPFAVFGTAGAYKLILAPDNDTDPPTSPVWTSDGWSGINDTATTSVDEWQELGITPTYVGATSFTIPGDQTTEVHVGRRLKTINSAGSVYSTVAAASYSDPNTTITVTNDAGSLDAGLTTVYLGILRSVTPSYPAPIMQYKGTAVASASSLTPVRDGNYFHVTGTTGISSISSNAPSPLYLVFDGAVTITHNATSMILPGGANITTAAGDRAIFVHEGSGNWRCIAFTKAVHPGAGATSVATQATTSGRSVTFTGLPAWVTKAVLTLVGVSTNGATDVLRVRLGTSGGLATTNYLGSVRNTNGATVNTISAGFDLLTLSAAAASWHGTVTITRHGTNGQDWVASWQVVRSDSGAVHDGGGSIALGAQLDRIALIVSGTTDDFDAGAVGMVYE